ncbi:hypothetical protein BV898_16281 [Hypsibius exemplaris]|uniref:Uncharacterized protein n=1 Tax=Hypsibius exemplaris TaxID=2072580 RepID=A0A9X6NFK5_HYPEX|nr:hypothetical protein BV898_16281 [Hypsibius exemplaris]
MKAGRNKQKREGDGRPEAERWYDAENNQEPHIPVAPPRICRYTLPLDLHSLAASLQFRQSTQCIFYYPLSTPISCRNKPVANVPQEASAPLQCIPAANAAYRPDRLDSASATSRVTPHSPKTSFGPQPLAVTPWPAITLLFYLCPLPTFSHWTIVPSPSPPTGIPMKRMEQSTCSRPRHQPRHTSLLATFAPFFRPAPPRGPPPLRCPSSSGRDRPVPGRLPVRSLLHSAVLRQRPSLLTCAQAWDSLLPFVYLGLPVFFESLAGGATGCYHLCPSPQGPRNNHANAVRSLPLGLALHTVRRRPRPVCLPPSSRTPFSASIGLYRNWPVSGSPAPSVYPGITAPSSRPPHYLDRLAPSTVIALRALELGVRNCISAVPQHGLWPRSPAAHRVESPSPFPLHPTTTRPQENATAIASTINPAQQPGEMADSPAGHQALRLNLRHRALHKPYMSFLGG